MKYPKGGDGLYDRFAKWAYSLYKRAWVSLIFAPAALAVPPAFITAYYANQTFKKAVNNYIPDVGTVLDNYVVVAILLAAAYPACILGFAISITRRIDSKGLSVDSLLHLLSSLDKIVGIKESRF